MNLAQQRTFLRALAHYLVYDQAQKSIELELQKPSAKEWADLRNASPIQGWADEDEAFKTLCIFFGVPGQP